MNEQDITDEDFADFGEASENTAGIFQGQQNETNFIAPYSGG